MPKKGENIYRRRDGRWEARYAKGIGPDGRRRYGSCYGHSYAEAKAKAEQARARLPAGASPAGAGSGRRPFACFCDEWLNAVEGCVKPSTFARYASAVAKYIKPRLGDFSPAAVTTGTVEAFKRELLDGGALAPKTVKDILVILQTILRYSARQLPAGLPAVDIRYPRSARREMRVLSVEEQRRFIGYLTCDLDRRRFGVLLALLTGLRIGELCALRWEDISLPERTLRVTATVQRLPDRSGGPRTQVVFGAPKSDRSARTIPLSDFALRLCQQIGPCRPAAFVLTGDEKWMEPRSLQYWMKKYTDACGLEGVHFHTLRHTFATRCVEAGFEIKSLSEILGHASTAVTMDCYVHSSMELKRKNIEKLSALGL